MRRVTVPPDAETRGMLRLDANPQAPAQARSFLRRCLSGVVRGSRLDTALLLASELVTNAVRHATPPIRVAVRVVGNLVRVEVSDSSPVLPRFRRSGPSAASGRGLPLLANLAQAWGADRHGSGKVVWFTVGMSRAERPADAAGLD